MKNVSLTVDGYTAAAAIDALPKLRQDLSHFHRNIEAFRRGPFADRPFNQKKLSVMQERYDNQAAAVRVIEGLKARVTA